ncbi:hypothetical protein [Desulforhopalus sp. 52FAK]
MRKTLLFILTFLACLSCYYLSSYWYPTATFFVSGSVSDNSSQISIKWDSGEGFNGYEWERFPLHELSVKAERDGIPVRITRTGERNSASLSAEIGLRSIYIDSQQYFPQPENLSPGIEFSSGKYVFKKDGASLNFLVQPKSHIQLEFPKFNGAGLVDVQIGEKVTRYDLYASNNESQWGGSYAKIVNSWLVTDSGNFTISMPMPRYPVQSLRVSSKGKMSISSAMIKTAEGKVISVSGGISSEHGINYSMLDADTQLRNHYHPERFLLQIVFALLTACILTWVFSFVSRFRGARDFFIAEQRYIFWLMLSCCCAVFSLWHLSFWPGVMSNDSLEVWRAAQIPGMYLGDHPPLNVILYIFLSQLWNNPAVVPLAQNFCTSLLIAYIFFSLFRRGLPLYCLVPCYGLIVLSVPVGLYSIILWKDVPFALIVVLLGFMLARLYRDKQQGKLPVPWSNWLLIFCLTLLLVGLRHNGVLYLFIVPFIIVLFGLVRIRPLAIVTLFVGTMLVAGAFFVIPGLSSQSSYLTGQTEKYLSQAVNRVSYNYLQNSAKKYLGVFDVNQNEMQWDLVHLCMYGRYTNDFLRELRWNDVYPYLPLPSNKTIKKIKGLAWKVYWKTYDKPWVYFSWNPVFMLLLYPLLPLFYRRFPMAATFSLFVMIPVGVLVFLGIFNWRYYYFAHLSSYFLLPMVFADFFQQKKRIEI